jgi:transcriptional regulator with XRE-family HTH domain
MNLGERIKLTRMQRKLSQFELSEKAHVHQKNISKYEQNGVVPSALTLKSIADALGVTTDYLLGEETVTIKDTALHKQFLDIENLPELERNALAMVIAAFIRDYKTKQSFI